MKTKVKVKERKPCKDIKERRKRVTEKKSRKAEKKKIVKRKEGEK